MHSHRFSHANHASANLNRYPADVICFIRILPIIRPWGFIFVGGSALHKSIIFPQACFRAVSFSRRRLCTRSLRNRTRNGTPIAQSERYLPGTCSDGTGEARRTPYRPGAPGSLPVSAVSVCCQARILWMLWADATWRRAPKQQGNLRRCRGAPNGSYITQIIGVR